MDLPVLWPKCCHPQECKLHLLRQYCFRPIALEPFSPMNCEARKFLSDLGQRISRSSRKTERLSSRFIVFSSHWFPLNSVLFNCVYCDWHCRSVLSRTIGLIVGVALQMLVWHWRWHWHCSATSFDHPDRRLHSISPVWLQLPASDFSVGTRWREAWDHFQVANHSLIADPTARVPGFHLPRRLWVLLNGFRTDQGHCTIPGADRQPAVLM